MKRKVLQLVGSFHTGGSERQAVQLADLLKTDGSFAVALACLNREGTLLETVEQMNFGEIAEFRLKSFYDASFLRQIRRCARFIAENKIEIVQTHDFYTNVFGMAAAKLAGTRARIAAKRETGGMRSGGQKLIEKQAFRLAKKIVVNSVAVRDYLIDERIAADKIVTIYNGLDLERLKPQTTNRADILNRFNLPSDREFITIVANLRHAVKNQEMFLRAAGLVKAKYEGAAFVLAGEGERENELKALAVELGIERDVYFVGRCGAVAELLEISEIGVLSSRNEGFSNSILEYLAAARPVVATRVGGAAEVITDGENGFLVESNDAERMAAKMLFLLENAETAREMGARGREIVAAKFSLDAQLSNTLRLYERILSEK